MPALPEVQIDRSVGTRDLLDVLDLDQFNLRLDALLARKRARSTAV